MGMKDQDHAGENSGAEGGGIHSRCITRDHNAVKNVRSFVHRLLALVLVQHRGDTESDTSYFPPGPEGRRCALQPRKMPVVIATIIIVICIIIIATMITIVVIIIIMITIIIVIAFCVATLLLVRQTRIVVDEIGARRGR